MNINTTAPKPTTTAPTKTKALTKTTKAAALAKKKRDKHVFKGRVDPDGSPAVTDLGDGAVLVEAFGRHAMGEKSSFVLDASDWERVRVTWGDQWVVVPHGKTSFFVGSGRREAIRDVAQPNSKPAVAALSRLLTDAKPGQVVAYADGNPFNLRSGNLLVLTHAAAGHRRKLLWEAQREAVLKANCPELWAALFGAAVDGPTNAAAAS